MRRRDANYLVLRDKGVMRNTHCQTTNFCGFRSGGYSPLFRRGNKLNFGGKNSAKDYNCTDSQTYWGDALDV
jgi:hypothetical protein